MFTKCHLVDTNATLRLLLVIPCYKLLIILLCVWGVRVGCVECNENLTKKKFFHLIKQQNSFHVWNQFFSTKGATFDII